MATNGFGRGGTAGGAPQKAAGGAVPPGRARTAPIALALGSGGLRGMAHIGVLKVLIENGIRPAFIAGTSAGSVIAALYAAGLEPAAIEELALSVRLHDLYDPTLNVWTGLQMAAKIAYDYLGVPPLTPPQAPLGLVRGDRFERLMAAKTEHKKFAETRIPLAIAAVDLNCGKLVVFCDERHIYPDATGKTIFLTDVSLAEAVRASIAIPVIFEPKRLAGRMLVDGGVKNYVPADILTRMGQRPVVAVDLGLADQRPADIDDIVEVMTQSVDIMARDLTSLKLKRSASVVIAPQTGDVGLADLRRIPEMIARGEQATRIALKQLLPVLGWAGPGGGR